MKRAIGIYGAFVDAIDRVVMAVCAVLLGVVVLLTAAEIIGRNVFKYSSPEMVDMTLSVAILVYLLGYYVLINRDQDVTMDFLYRRMRPATRRWLDILTSAGTFVFFVVLTAKSWRLFQLGMNSIHPVFPVPHGVVALPVLVASAFCVLAALRRLIDSIATFAEGGVPPWERAP